MFVVYLDRRLREDCIDKNKEFNFWFVFFEVFVRWMKVIKKRVIILGDLECKRVFRIGDKERWGYNGGSSLSYRGMWLFKEIMKEG